MNHLTKHREQPCEQRSEQTAEKARQNRREYGKLVLISLVCSAVSAFLVNLVLFLLR